MQFELDSKGVNKAIINTEKNPTKHLMHKNKDWTTLLAPSKTKTPRKCKLIWDYINEVTNKTKQSSNSDAKKYFFGGTFENNIWTYEGMVRFRDVGFSG